MLFYHSFCHQPVLFQGFIEVTPIRIQAWSLSQEYQDAPCRASRGLRHDSIFERESANVPASMRRPLWGWEETFASLTAPISCFSK